MIQWNRITLAAALAAAAPAAAHAQDAAQAAGTRTYGIVVGAGVAAAPLGEVAKSYGLPAVPGAAVDARLIARASDGVELSLGLTGDYYEVRQDARPYGSWEFHYASMGAVAGRSVAHSRGAVPRRYGLELGWRWFDASSMRPDVYEGAMQSSRVSGHAALLGVTYAVEIPAERYTVAPRLRLETSYPDFGGGDGYSALHRESDLGFRASVGVEIRKMF